MRQYVTQRYRAIELLCCITASLNFWRQDRDKAIRQCFIILPGGEIGEAMCHGIISQSEWADYAAVQA